LIPFSTRYLYKRYLDKASNWNLGASTPSQRERTVVLAARYVVLRVAPRGPQSGAVLAMLGLGSASLRAPVHALRGRRGGGCLRRGLCGLG
jgi:hypothetical protein